jgi:hypothetical protein
MAKQQGPPPVGAGSRRSIKAKSSNPVVPSKLKGKKALPKIKVNNRQLRDITCEALKALQDTNNPPQLFVRDRRMVTTIRNDAGRIVICNVDENMLKARLTRSANFFKVYKRPNGPKLWIDCLPSLDAVKDILALPPAQWEFPSLEGVIEAPCLRPDGTIIQEAGYDPATRLLFVPAKNLCIQRIPERPTSDQIRRALDNIGDIIAGFPFVDEASRTNALATLLTPINRPAISGSIPMALIDATTQGTGKTLLCAVFSLIVSGREPNLYSTPKESEEFRRLLSGILSEAGSLVIFDNVSIRLDSLELCRAITTTFWGDRILKLNQTFELPVRCTWIANGNNLQLGGDMPRRCYWVRMDAQCARPFQRTGFKHPDLKTFVWERRGELLVSLLTLSGAWYAAGRPKPQTPHLGSFESWTHTIGGILEHAGVSGFLGNSEELYEQADRETQQWEHFFLSLNEVFRGDSFRVSELVNRLAKSNDGLRDALPDFVAEVLEKTGFLQRRLGTAFAERLGRRFGDSGVFIEKRGKVHHAQMWSVVLPRLN